MIEMTMYLFLSASGVFGVFWTRFWNRKTAAA